MSHAARSLGDPYLLVRRPRRGALRDTAYSIHSPFTHLFERNPTETSGIEWNGRLWDTAGMARILGTNGTPRKRQKSKAR